MCQQHVCRPCPGAISQENYSLSRWFNSLSYSHWCHKREGMDGYHEKTRVLQFKSLQWPVCLKLLEPDLLLGQISTNLWTREVLIVKRSGLRHGTGWDGLTSPPTGNFCFPKFTNPKDDNTFKKGMVALTVSAWVEFECMKSVWGFLAFLFIFLFFCCQFHTWLDKPTKVFLLQGKASQ